MFNTANSLSLLIGKSVSRTASVQITDSAASAYIVSGEILVLDENDTPLVAGMTITDTKSIKIVQGDGTSNPLVYSPRIFGANVTVFKGMSYVAPQEQIYYVGYNGSSGSIDVSTASNQYIIRVLYKFDSEIFSEQTNVLYQEYTSDAAPTQSEVAAGFAVKYAQTYPATNNDVKVERVCDGTFTVTGGSTTAVVTLGSTTVTFSSSSHALVAGDILRIGGTLSTFPAYVVSSVSGATVILDSKYQGASGTIANANLGEMSAVTAWGLKFTGKPFTFTAASVARFKYQKVAFDMTIQNFGSTSITQSQEASRGNGTFEEVAELEYWSLGFDGWLANRNTIPAQAQPRTNATASTNYDIISISAFDNSDFGVISGTKPSPFQVYLAIVEGAAQTTNILAQLNPWMASTPRAFAAVTV